MASTRPPGTYSPSARTGRRGGGSGSVAGMVRRAGSSGNVAGGAEPEARTVSRGHPGVGQEGEAGCGQARERKLRTADLTSEGQGRSCLA